MKQVSYLVTTPESLTLTNSEEILGDIQTSRGSNTDRSTWMTLEESSSIIHLSIDNKPRLLAATVGLEFLQINHAVHPLFLHVNLLDRLRLNRLLTLNSLAPVPIRQVTTSLLVLLHPSACLCRVSWVLELETASFFGDGDTEPGVVHHPQDRPVHVSRLSCQSFIHGSDEQCAAVLQV